MLVSLKLKILFFLCFCLSRIAVNAQCILEQVEINLPKDIKWKLFVNKTYADSAERQIIWLPVNETKQNRTQLLEILTVEKNEKELMIPRDSFYQYMANTVADMRFPGKIDLPEMFSYIDDNGVSNPDTRFLLLKGTPKTRHDTSHTMMLQWAINGRTSIHLLNISVAKEKFTPSFIDKWKKIFAKVRIIQPAVTELTKTIFIFSSGEELPADSNMVYKLKMAVKGRIKEIYKREITENNFEAGKETIRLTLRGDIDTTEARQVLGHSINRTDVVFLKADTAITGIKKRINSLQIEHQNNAVLQLSGNDGALSYNSEIAYARVEDTLAARKLLQEISIPVSRQFYFKKVTGNDQFAQLYLLDKNPLITADELIACSSTFAGASFPAIAMELNNSGKQKLALYTKEHTGEMLAIIVNGKILSAAIITGEIPDGKLLLSDGMTMMEVVKYLDKIGYPYPIPLTLTAIGRK